MHALHNTNPWPKDTKYAIFNLFYTYTADWEEQDRFVRQGKCEFISQDPMRNPRQWVSPLPGVWRSWLARLVWDQEVEGSSPFTPTK